MSEKRIKVWLVCPNDRPSFQGQWKCPASGRVLTRSLKTGDEAEAEKRRADLEYELNHGLAQGREAPGPMRWAEFAARYMAQKLGERAEGTRVKAAQVFADFAGAQKPGRLADVDERMMSRHAEWLRGRGRRPATVASHLAYLRAALNWAARQKLVKAAPHIDQPAVPDPGIRPWTDEAGYKRLHFLLAVFRYPWYNSPTRRISQRTRRIAAETADMAMRLMPIDPTLTYSVTEAAALVPGKSGTPVHPVTMSNWCKRGTIQARQIGGTWFIEGTELIRFREGQRSGGRQPEPAAAR